VPRAPAVGTYGHYASLVPAEDWTVLGAARPTGPRDETRELLPQLTREGDQDR